MHRWTIAMAAVLTLVGASAAAGQATPQDVAYRVVYAGEGRTHVSIDIAWRDPLPEPRPLVMPRAIPMGYGEQRYDAFVTNLRATTADGRTREPAREDGPRWRLDAGVTRVAYDVDLRRLEEDVRAASDQSRVRDGYLGALGYAIFAFVDGAETRPVTLRIEGPGGWPIFSTLAPRWPAAAAPIDARAPDFYALADSQIVMGPRAEIRRLATAPVPLYLVAYAEGPVDLDRVGRLAATAFTRVVDYFGGAPFAHYTVHQELLTPVSPRHEYGMSMEHLDSSTYYLAASSGLTAAATAEDEARVLFNFAHHMAHAWVPKRAWPRGYFPFQWELAPVLDAIWFAEGFGQYAAIAAVARGEADPAAYRERLLERRFRSTIATVPAFLARMELVELSRVASTRYAEDFRTGRLVFSRGGLMAAALDDRIRDRTKGAKSLRDALRFLVAWSARTRRGFAVDELAPLVRDAVGVDVRDIVDTWLAPLPAAGGRDADRH